MKQLHRKAPPGRFARMTRVELDAQSDRYDSVLAADESTPMSAAQRAEYVAKTGRKRGPAPKPPGEKAARVLVTIEPGLLAATDAAAEKSGQTRAGFIAQALQSKLRIKPRIKRAG